GGGAAGYFTAANLGKELGKQTVLFEQSSLPLQKVRISGGGRCNVTHACFDPNELVEFYPRGKKELRSVFHKFQPSDTMEWFERPNVSLKIEEDNRIFRISDSSLSVIECLLDEDEKNQVETRFNETVLKIDKKEKSFLIQTKSIQYKYEKIIFTPGGSVKWLKFLRN